MPMGGLYQTSGAWTVPNMPTRDPLAFDNANPGPEEALYNNGAGNQTVSAVSVGLDGATMGTLGSEDLGTTFDNDDAALDFVFSDWLNILESEDDDGANQRQPDKEEA